MSHRKSIRISLAGVALLFAFGFSLSGVLSDSHLFLPADRAQWRIPASLLSPVPSEGRYKIEAGQSRFIVKAFAGGLLSAFAHDHTIAIRDFGGEVKFTYGMVEPASMQLNIKADSLAVQDKVSESDRQKIENTMRSEVLEVDKYSEIVFKGDNVTAQRVDEGKYQTKINGELTLHGTTHPVTIPATVEFSQNSLRAQGQFSLRQTDYGIKPVSIAGGSIKVKNELKFTFDIVASR